MVIDASALLAVFQNEPGQEVVGRQIEAGAFISAVNVTEVIGKLVSAGVAPENEAREDVLGLGLTIVPFDSRAAVQASFFYARRRPYNLSLGDCACLALAQTRAEPVLTFDRAWAKLPDLSVEVQVIR